MTTRQRARAEARPRAAADSARREPPDFPAVEQVVRHVGGLVEKGALRPGDQLPAERQLAAAIGVSRPTVRAGLQALAAMGVLSARHGSGTFVTDGPPRLGAAPLGFLAALHGFTRDEMFEARRVLEVGAAALAAERGLAERLAPIAEELAGMFASLDEPQTFLVHDVNFHRAVAAASGNPVLTALVEMVSSLVYEQRRRTISRAKDLKQAAELHRRIYQAIRDRDPERARHAMGDHLDQARQAQAQEDHRPPRSSEGGHEPR
jgi:GntR family transcriptional repressor for pyruvate dehydrogenase complex